MCFHAKPFIETLKLECREIKENFTYLAYGWMHALASSCDFDERNEGSVMMARDICLHIPEMPQINKLTYKGEHNMDVDTADISQVVCMMSVYLEADSENTYQDFLLYACNEHRTLQQSITRLFREWFLAAKECKAAQEASKYVNGHILPEI